MKYRYITSMSCIKRVPYYSRGLFFLHLLKGYAEAKIFGEMYYLCQRNFSPKAWHRRL